MDVDPGDRRWPRSLYGVGTEPDPRFTFANERTFLAWIRTSLALLAGGVALEALDLPVQPDLRFAAAIVLVALLDAPSSAGLTFEELAGETPIAEAIAALAT